MGDIEITVEGLEKTVRKLDEAGRKQIPYAIKLALDMTAFNAREELIADLPNVFTIRRPWTEKGMRVEKATKANLEAAVGSTRPYMKTQATGGLKFGRSKSLSIPMGTRPQKTVDVKRSAWPAAMMKKKRFFIGPTEGGAMAVWQRPKGMGRRLGPMQPPKLMWLFKRRIALRHVWPLVDTVRKVAMKKWRENATSALKRALETAR